jgi:hypothetical protein
VTRKCDLHPGSLIQTNTDGIAGCSWRDNLSLVMTLLFFPSKMEGIPSKERFVNQPPKISSIQPLVFQKRKVMTNQRSVGVRTSIQPPNFQIRKVMTKQAWAWIKRRRVGVIINNNQVEGLWQRQLLSSVNR